MLTLSLLSGTISTDPDSSAVWKTP